MSAVAFDTLKLAKRLEQAGFSRDQASGAAEALADTFTTELATKRDVQELRSEIALGSTALRADIARQIADVRGEIASLRSTTAQWVVGVVFVNALAMLGGLAAVWQLAHH